MSAAVIRQLQNIPIEIYYGAFELSFPNIAPDDGTTPVFRLDGLLKMLEFLTALSSYDKDGDYAAFAHLFRDTGGQADLAELLSEASYKEYTGDFAGAALELGKFQEKFNGFSQANALSLFADEFNKRFAWTTDKNHYSRQAAQAQQSLARGDLMRAAIWGVEAVETRLSQRSKSAGTPMPKPGDFDFWKNYFEAVGLEYADCLQFQLLKKIRNRLAHAHEGEMKQDLQYAMATRESCIKTIQTAFDVLLPERL